MTRVTFRVACMTGYHLTYHRRARTIHVRVVRVRIPLARRTTRETLHDQFRRTRETKPTRPERLSALSGVYYVRVA